MKNVITNRMQTASTLPYKQSDKLSEAMFLVLLQGTRDGGKVVGTVPMEAVV